MKNFFCKFLSPSRRWFFVVARLRFDGGLLGGAELQRDDPLQDQGAHGANAQGNALHAGDGGYLVKKMG